MSALSSTTLDPSTTPANLFGRDEMNLAEFPLTLLTDTAKAGQKTLYFEGPQGRLTVTGSDAYGLPTASDADVIVALLCLSKKRNDFANAKVEFSRYELLKILGWSDIGDNYRRLDQSFNRWSGVLLIYDKCWWDNKRHKYVSAKMHILESVVVADAEARGDRDELPLSTFTWNQTFIESCQNDNLRSLDLDTYRILKSSLSKRLYRFLGKRFYKQSVWTFDLKELAFERIGISRNYADAGKIKEKLKPALEELEAIGFLEPLDRGTRYQKIQKGQWSIRLSQKTRAVVAAPEIEVAEPPVHPIVAELLMRGVTQRSAEALAAEFPAEAIGLKIEQFDFLNSRNDPKVSKSPSGYLVSSIRSDYAAPKGFVSRAEQDRRLEVKDAKARVAAEERRRKAEADANDNAEQAALDARIQAMPPAERQALEESALQAAGPEACETYQTLRRFKVGVGYLAQLTRDHLRSQERFSLSSDPA